MCPCSAGFADVKRLLAGVLLVLLCACAGKPPLVVERSLSGAGPEGHLVAPGDTLYSIAMRYEKDYRELARINVLDDSYLIRPGQRLRLSGSPAPVSASSGRRPVLVVKSPPVVVANKPKPSVSVTPVAKNPPPVGKTPSVVTAQSPASASLDWSWPANGALLARFGSPGLAGKGLDIAGRQGDSVRAASDGMVVYAGSGLVGYGKLLILRHDDNYISAYAHNDRFMVKEGDSVKLGQTIALMGASGTDREKLHFEIREGGKPVDPQRLLPARE